MPSTKGSVPPGKQTTGRRREARQHQHAHRAGAPPRRCALHRGVEPPLEDPTYDPAFDALAYIVEAGHRAGLEVHAWINAMPVWRDDAPPKDPRHVFNRHGIDAPGDENWLTASPDGNHKFPVGYFLDPGHPAAAAYSRRST